MTIDPRNLSTTAVQTFAEEFDSLSLWDGTQGRWCTTYAFVDSLSNGSTLSSNGEQEYYINSRYAPTAAVKPWSVANSILTITAAKASPAISPLINNYQYTSGQLNTFHSFNQTYGYYEARMLLPKGQGLWPAFWLLPQSLAWPPEIDVMEVLGHDLTRLYTTVHTNSTGTHTSSGTGTTVADMSTGFHLYGVGWEPDFIVFYFDRAEIFRTPTPADLKNQPMYMLLDLAVGGSWPGPADASTPFPAQMQVDYVRAYRPLSASVAPPPVPPPAPPPPAPVPSPSVGGIVLTGNDTPGQVLMGSSGNDTFYPGHNSVVMTGNGGANRYVYKDVPWNAGRITDFRLGIDRLDMSALSANAAPNSGTVEQLTSLENLGTGGTLVRFKTPFQWPYPIVTLDGVPFATVTVAKLFNPPPAPVVSAFGAALTIFVDNVTTTPVAEKIAELKKQVTRLGG